jgi:hypothetical protein
MAHGNLDLAAYHALYLTQEDLPTLRILQDHRDDDATPYADFDRCGGRAYGNMWWNGDDADELWMVHDYRWVFPDADNAIAFLQSHEAGLSAGPAHIVPIPVAYVGDDCVVWDDTTWNDFVMPPIKMEAISYDFRVKNVVAAVSVTAGPDAPEGTLKLATVTSLATVAVNRIAAITG